MKKTMLALMTALSLIMGVGTGTALAGTLTWPVPASHTLSQGYHDGNAIDISASTGTTVVAAMSGKVTTIYKCGRTHLNYGDCNGFGTGIVILGDDGRAYQYAHMQAGSIPANVYYGARVSQGQKVGCVGMTGYATGPHLHFGISYNSKYWQAGPNPATLSYGSVAPNVRVSQLAATNVTKTNAKLSATATKNSGDTVTACGVYLGTSTRNMTKRNTEGVGAATNRYRNGTGFDIWYDLNSELGIRLSAGTTYYYKFYCVAGGREFQSGVASFRTPANPVVRRNQSMRVSPSLKTYKRSTLKRKAQSYSLKVTGAQGKVTYRSSSKYLKVSANGWVTVKKGTPKGYYSMLVTAAGNTYYYSHSYVVGVKVK